MFFKELLKKFYENIDWDKIKEESELNYKSDEENGQTDNNDKMKLQLKEKTKNYFQGNDPYKSSGGIVSGIGSPSSRGLHWINIATTNSSIRKNTSNAKPEFTPGSPNNAAKELMRIINNVTSMSVETNSVIGNVGSQGLEPLLSPSTENFNASINISSLGSKSNQPVNKLHFLKVDGQKVDYLHTVQSSSNLHRKSQSSFGISSQNYKMSFRKSSTSSTSSNSTPSASSSVTPANNNNNKKTTTKIIDLSNYRNFNNLDFIKSTVRESFEGKDNIKLPDLNSKNLDTSSLSNNNTSASEK